MQELTQWLREAGIAFHVNVPLCQYTTFHIGGAASCMAFPKTAEQLRLTAEAAASADLPCRILGNGSNILAPDEGVEGLVICTKQMHKCTFSDGYFEAEAGMNLSLLLREAAHAGYGGAEELCGIPATVGGAVCMNAGAFGKEISAFVRQVRVFDPLSMTFRRMAPEALSFAYRHSSLQESGEILCSASIALSPTDTDDALRRMQDFTRRRQAAQPRQPSAGSFFRREPDCIPARLMDMCGLKGMRVGDAAISEKHAGFIVNLAAATAADVRTLAQAAERAVQDRFGVRMCPEVKIW